MQNHRMSLAQAVVLVQIERFEGSSPREAGAWLCVNAQGFEGTVGGGHLEFEALAQARRMLADASTQRSARELTQRYALGPALGQCCGGVVWLRFERFDSSNAPEFIALYEDLMRANTSKHQKIALFGGGHVGQALVRTLACLPMQLRWIDSRDEIFPSNLPPHVQTEHSSPVQSAVRELTAGSHVLIMSFSHAEDLDVVIECLKRQREKADLPFIGLIGSQTKWATFRHRLEDRGFTAEEIAQVTCPIGIDGVHGKEPEVIAVSVAAQLLRLRRLAA
jgi:xanthine dehydrogenase accessory factor